MTVADKGTVNLMTVTMFGLWDVGYNRRLVSLSIFTEARVTLLITVTVSEGIVASKLEIGDICVWEGGNGAASELGRGQRRSPAWVSG